MENKCNAFPYVGRDSFVFVHFSNKDQNAAYTLIERLAAEGFRVWYVSQADIMSCCSEELANLINRKIGECAAVVSLYSSAAGNDHQFRKIITASVLNRKKTIPVFLEDVQLSCGMRLQIGNEEKINWYAVTDELQALYGKKTMKCVKGEPNSSIHVVYRELYSADEQEEQIQRNEWPVSIVVVDEELFSGKVKKSDADRKPAEDSEVQPKGESAANNENAAEESTPPGFDRHLDREESKAEPETVLENRRVYDRRTEDSDKSCVKSEKNACATMLMEEELCPRTQTETDEGADIRMQQGRNGTVIIEEIDPIAVLLPTGERYMGCYGMTRVGRGADNHICIPRNTVSTCHMEVISVAGADGIYKNTIKDCCSSNGTWVNGKRLEAGYSVVVGECAMINLSRKVRLFMAFGDKAEQLAGQSVLACLECCETRGMQVIDEASVTIGRLDPWNNDFFNDSRISWEHARIDYVAGNCKITDHSSNGTYINGKRIEKHKETELVNGDEIIMGRRTFRFHLITLKEI